MNQKAILILTGTLPVTSVVQTSGGKLPYRCIYHAVGPMWSSYNTAELGGVEQCTKDLMETLLCCFKKADEDEMRSVAMASISAGKYLIFQGTVCFLVNGNYVK